MKVFDHIWLWLILLFAGYVLIANTPEGRIVRICEPINWSGRLFESLAMLAMPEKAIGVRDYMASTEKGCHAMIYRQMYPLDAKRLEDEQDKAAKAIDAKKPKAAKAAPVADEDESR